MRWGREVGGVEGGGESKGGREGGVGGGGEEVRQGVREEERRWRFFQREGGGELVSRIAVVV